MFTFFLSFYRCNGHAPLPADSAYFTTSESKAKFLTQYVKDMHNESLCRTDGQELQKQKVCQKIILEFMTFTKFITQPEYFRRLNLLVVVLSLCFFVIRVLTFIHLSVYVFSV